MGETNELFAVFRNFEYRFLAIEYFRACKNQP